MNKNDKIFIAGHKGFVGSNLYRKLIEDEYTNIITTYIDLLDQKDTESFISSNKPNYIFICAAIVGGIKANIENSYKFLYDNLQIQNNIINTAIYEGVKKVLFLGSSCIYPTDYKQPLKEEYLMAAPLEKTNEAYSLAKIAGLKMCEYANRQFKTRFISLMPCNLYGHGDNFKDDNSHVVSALIRKIYNAKINKKMSVKIWGSGEVFREFLYIDDLIDCMIWYMHRNEYIESFLNVGTGEEVSIKTLIDIISRIIGYSGEFVYDKTKPDGMKRRKMDVSKINQLGWKAKVSLYDGLKKTIEYYQRNYL